MHTSAVAGHRQNVPARETACRRPHGVGSWTSTLIERGPPIGRRRRSRRGERRAGTQQGWPSLTELTEVVQTVLCKAVGGNRHGRRKDLRQRQRRQHDKLQNANCRMPNAYQCTTKKKKPKDTATDPSKMKTTSALLAVLSAAPLTEGFVGNMPHGIRSSAKVRQHARFSTISRTADAASASTFSTTSVSATLPSPEESAQALQDYMVKAHQDKARAVREIEEKTMSRIQVCKLTCDAHRPK